jgi:hypothetical protein
VREKIISTAVDSFILDLHGGRFFTEPSLQSVFGRSLCASTGARGHGEGFASMHAFTC